MDIDLKYKHDTFPAIVLDLLNKLEAPARLIRHLFVVHFTAINIIENFKREWNNLDLDEQSILLGAATHDIGKIRVTQELNQPGSKHLSEGEKLLLENDFEPKFARFARTHENWRNEPLPLDDLLVSLSDELWKGKRVNDLEELICKEIAKRLNEDFWNIYMQLGKILEDIALGSDDRIAYQK